MIATAVKKRALSQEVLRELNELIPQEKKEHYNYQDLASLVQVLSGEPHLVGYTHEDVYKRQLPALPLMRIFTLSGPTLNNKSMIDI